MISMLLMLGCGGTWLAAQGVSGGATTDPQIPAARPLPAAQDASGTATTYPQIVRVSLLEGDVRVARGVEGRKAKGSGWEKAVVDLPIESGFSLVTGADGRVEIEFEDASTVYLAPNSVLAFNELSSTGGVPRTELALLSGTMTLDVKPMAPAEWFSVRTPVNGFSVRYPDQAYLRVGSYLDGMTLTSLRPTVFHVNGASALPAAGGMTVTFHPGKAPAQAPEDKAQFAAWDNWVGQRVVHREQAMQATMKEAGLKTPIPGLAEMRGQGTFFDCAPYGTCWEPNAQASGAAAQPALQRAEDPAVTAALARQTVSVSQLKQGGGQVAAGQAGQMGQNGLTPYDFPCSPWWQQSLYRRDPLTGRLLQNPYPYSWAVCHTGSWIPRGRRYVWVVGVKRHHHHPYHWVKTGKTAGYVPIHPRDVAGKPPVNLKNGLLRPDLSRKDGSGAVDRIAYNDGQKVKLLDEAPKAFRNEVPLALERADEPRAVAFRMGDRAGQDLGGSKVALARPVGVPVTFDRKSQSFMVAQTMERGGVTRTVAEPIGGRGSSLQTHSGGVGGGYSGGASASRASFSSGGGSSYSGGGGHVSAPAASVSAGPSASASSGGGASAASAGGGKH
jgi:uncharacterized membrane protein YgcG